MDQTNAASPQRRKQQLLGPGLLVLAEPAGAAAHIKQRGKLLGLTLAQQSFQPRRLGFEHPEPLGFDAADWGKARATGKKARALLFASPAPNNRPGLPASVATGG